MARRGLAGILPGEVRWRRTKVLLSGSTIRRFRADRPLLDDLLLDAPGRLDAYLDLPVVRQTYAHLLNADQPTLADVDVVLRAAWLSAWLG